MARPHDPEHVPNPPAIQKRPATTNNQFRCVSSVGSVMIGIFWGIRFLPKQLVNIPHRDYWLADERRVESAAYLGWHSVWFGVLMLTFVIGLHWLIVSSNQLQPASLPFVWLMMVLGPFLLGVAGWVYFPQRHFHSPGMESQSAA